MVTFAHSTLKRFFHLGRVRRGGLLNAGLFASALGLAGCAVEVVNFQPAQEVAQPSTPPGSVYLGWRVFQDKCSVCHGPAAAGTPRAPDLLPIVRDMGPRRFVSLVLQRYDLSLPVAQAQVTGDAREALIDQIVQGKDAPMTMPAWGDNPRVSAHTVDLYAYLRARAQGRQGPERPAQAQ